MGKKLGAQDQNTSEYITALYTISDLIQQRQKKPWHYNNFIYGLTQEGRQHKACLKILHKFTDQVT